MFYYGPFTMPGYPTVKGEGLWSKQDEVDVLRLLPTSAVGLVLELKDKYNVKVVAPKYVPLPEGVPVVEGMEIPAAAVMECEEGLVLALMPEGLKRAKKEFENQLGVGSFEVAKNIEAIIIHEATHLEQVATGRLKELPTQEMIWEGELWTKERLNEVGYINHPWEVEAITAQIKHVIGDRPELIEMILQKFREDYYAKTSRK